MEMSNVHHQSGNPIMPGSITGGSYMNDAPLSGSETLFHQFIATDSGSYDTITYFYTGNGMFMWQFMMTTKDIREIC